MKVVDGELMTNSGTVVTHLSQLRKYFFNEEKWKEGRIVLNHSMFGEGKRGEKEMADFFQLIRDGELQVIDGPHGSPTLECVNKLGPGPKNLKFDRAVVEADVPMPLRTKDRLIRKPGRTNKGKKFFAYHKFEPTLGDSSMEQQLVLVGHAGGTVTGGSAKLQNLISQLRNGGCVRVAVLRRLLCGREIVKLPITLWDPAEHVVQLGKERFADQVVVRRNRAETGATFWKH